MQRPSPARTQPVKPLHLQKPLGAVHPGHQLRGRHAMWHYATVNRVANVMRPYLASVTA
jgi:hypothetical protein